MGVSAATLTIYAYPKGYDETRTNTIVRGTISLSQGTYPTGGYSLTWTGIERLFTTATLPTDCDIKSVASTPSGIVYQWDSTNGKMHVFISNNGVSAASGPLIEFGGTLPQWMFSDTIQFTAVFPRNN